MTDQQKKFFINAALKRKAEKENQLITNVDSVLKRISNQYAAQQILIRRLREQVKEKGFRLPDDEVPHIEQWVKNHKLKCDMGDDNSYNYIFDEKGFVGVECKKCKKRGL